MRRRWWAVIGLAAVVAMVAAASAPADTPKYGGVLNLKPTETVDTIVGELPEKWSWQDGYRNLVFFLPKGVKWRDGQPFKNLVPHHSLYNFGRMQEVWLDR
jgi:hypothetical protein